MTLKQTAQDVLALLERGTYEAAGPVSIATDQAAAVNGSRLYRPDDLTRIRRERPGRPVVDVHAGTTQEWAQKLSRTSDLMLLNFASARNPGGGFLNGAKAQEEDLCRCSGLYPTLLAHPDYYRANRSQRSLLYTDHAIYSPRVPFFRTTGTGELLPSPFRASVVTAPAPNTGPHLRAHPGTEAAVEEAFERRWRNVLAIAEDQGHSTVLLGAWGCGAFGGDPVVASRTAARAIAAQGQGIDRVVFAIPDRGTQSRRNLEAFRATFPPTAP